MPPKSFTQKKSLTPLERKMKKRKQDIIHKAKVKSQYYKDLASEYAADTPDYVKEIFERTIDEDGNVVEFGDGQAKIPSTDERKRKAVEHGDDGSDSDDDASAKTHKPNPFRSQLEEQDKRRRAGQDMKKERHAKVEQEKADRKRYFQHRNKQRGKMLAKHKNGQPNLATQMSIMLGRIEKS
ncbi:hypothetical protein BC940DRAFT_310234 [Gongronella butleri]|nr:hypothetical protein BC940DRAFT_310234 [Gongronella butleri]